MTLPRSVSLLTCALWTAACSSPDTNAIHAGLRDAGGKDADTAQPEQDADSEPEPELDASAEPVSDAETAGEMLDAAVSAPASDAAPLGAEAGAEAGASADAAADASTDASTGPGVAPGLLKSRCGAPANLDNAPRIAGYPIMRSRPNGNIAVTWQEIDTQTSPYRNVVRTFVNGALGAPHVLSENATSRAEAAIDDQGNIHVRWADPPIGQDREREDYNATTAQWSGKAQWFTNRGSEITSSLHMFALNRTGLTLYTTFYNLNGAATAAIAVFEPTSFQWGALQPLEASINNAGPQIPHAALNDAGQGVVIWGYRDNTTGQNLHSFRASTLAAGSFGAPVIVAGGTDFYGMTLLSGGDALLVYSNTDRVSARRFSPAAPAGSQWSAEQTVDMRQSGEPTLVVDAADRVTAVYTVGRQVRAARYEGGAWQPVADIGPTDLGFDVALDASGNVSVIYGAEAAPIKVRRLAAAGGSWTDAIDVANEAGTKLAPMVAHDPAGNVVVAYSLGRALPQGGADSHIRWLVCE